MSKITKKTTGIKSNQKLADLKFAIEQSINEWIYKHCNNVTDFNKLVEKQLEQDICPLEAEYWEYKQKWGYRITIFAERFTQDFKDEIIKNLKNNWKDIIDLETEQIIAGTEY